MLKSYVQAVYDNLSHLQPYIKYVQQDMTLPLSLYEMYMSMGTYYLKTVLLTGVPLIGRLCRITFDVPHWKKVLYFVSYL